MDSLQLLSIHWRLADLYGDMADRGPMWSDDDIGFYDDIGVLEFVAGNPWREGKPYDPSATAQYLAVAAQADITVPDSIAMIPYRARWNDVRDELLEATAA